MLNSSVLSQGISKSQISGKYVLTHTSKINDAMIRMEEVQNRITTTEQLALLSNLWKDPIFASIDLNGFPEVALYQYGSKISETVQFNEIELTSRCEAQPVIIDGMANISFIPKDYMIRYSDLINVIGFLSERPQNQQRLTQQIMLCLQTLLQTDDVFVSIDAILFAIKSKNMTEAESGPLTIAKGGKFDLSKAPITLPFPVSLNL